MPSPMTGGHPPYPTGPHCLLVAIDADAVAGWHIALGWRMPERIIDLMVEFRNSANGHRVSCGSGLVGALLWFGLPTVGAFSCDGRPAGSCSRVEAVSRLFDVMRPTLDISRALFRGRYMIAVSRIEAIGVPIDQFQIEDLKTAWPAVRKRFVEIVDQNFGVYKVGRFQPQAFETWVENRGIAWPLTRTGHIDLSDATFRDMARVHPELRALRELRATLSGFDPCAIAISPAGRNCAPIRPFASRTGRNQPSSKASIFGKAAWVRNLVRPSPGMGLALIDWTQQEFGIAAALSEDADMLAAYGTEDP